MATNGNRFAALWMVATSFGLLVSPIAADAKHAHQRVYSSPAGSAHKRLIAQSTTSDTSPSTPNDETKTGAEKKSLLKKVIPLARKAQSQPEQPANAGPQAAKKKAEASNPTPTDKSDNLAATPLKRSQSPAAATAAASTIAAAQETSDSAEQIDTALLSILRDLSKAARESDDLQKLEDPAQRAAAESALQALDSSLARANLHPNRIVAGEQKDHFSKSLTAESWESGMIMQADRTHASLNVLWAKKVNGLINVSIAGTFKHADEKGTRSGQYVVVLSGRSVLDSGFDIQSQSNVNYWLGKLTAVSVDASAGEVSAAPIAMPILKAVLTDDWVQRRNLLEQAARVVESPLEKKLDSTGGTSVSIAAGAGENVAPAANAGADNTAHTANADAGDNTALAANAGAGEKAGLAEASVNKADAVIVSPDNASAAQLDSQPAPVQPPAGQPATALRPSAGAHPVVPERAIAGENVTVAIVDSQGRPEPFVEVTFNDAVVVTGRDGKAIYAVPEDAIPGPTLRIGLKERPEAAPAAIYILQPLVRAQSTEIPKIDRISSLVTAGSTIAIDGHNFDGIAEHNHVILDGGKQAPVLVASPVQLRALLPSTIAPGHHVLTISTNGLHSNTAGCEFVAVSIEALGNREKANKFVVKVVGTQSKVKLRLQNESPELIKLVKGDEFVTPGGSNNLVTVNAQRLGRGVFRISANIEGTQ